MIPILLPLIITVLGLIYIFSPIDFIPEIVLGPIGLADDILVVAIVVLTWILYLSAPIIEIFLNLLIFIGIITVLIYIINRLHKGGKKSKKISLFK